MNEKEICHSKFRKALGIKTPKTKNDGGERGSRPNIEIGPRERERVPDTSGDEPKQNSL